MLSERVCKALSAFVDGEASPALREAVLRLVHRSAEARAYLDKLNRDRRRLQALPRKQLSPDFPDQVLAAVAQRRLTLRQKLAPRPRPTLPAWVGVAAAASVLLLVGFAAFSFFRQPAPAPATPPVVAQQENNGVPPEAPPGDGEQHAKTPHDQPLPQEPSGPGDLMTPPGDAIARDPAEPPREPNTVPVVNPPDPLTLPLARWELFGPRTVDVTLPVVQKLADLDISELRAEFQKDSGFRVELPCRDSYRAFERLQAACKTQGVTLLVDQVVQARLKQPTLHTNFVVFGEDLGGEDLLKLLQQVAADDRKAEAKKKGDAAFTGLLVFRMDRDDRKELADLLGIDPRHVQGGKPGGPLNLDPKTPVSDNTANQVVQSLTGQGSTSRNSESPGTSAKGPEPRALVLPYNPVRVRPASSAEVKRFLEARKPLRAGALQVLIVVREVTR
jgi:hypothetical protein